MKRKLFRLVIFLFVLFCLTSCSGKLNDFFDYGPASNDTSDNAYSNICHNAISSADYYAYNNTIKVNFSFDKEITSYDVYIYKGTASNHTDCLKKNLVNPSCSASFVGRLSTTEITSSSEWYVVVVGYKNSKEVVRSEKVQITYHNGYYY